MKDYQSLYIEEKFKLWEEIFLKILTQYPNTTDLINCLLKNLKISEIYQKCQLTLFVPCKPMLAKPTKALG